MSSTRPYDQIGQDHLSWLPQKQIGPTPRAHEPKTSERREPTRTRWLQSLLEPNRERRIYLTDTLAAEVFLHVATNADPMTANNAPQILCIAGPFGSGKTTGIEEALHRAGCVLVRIHASELESQWANVPANLLRKAYVDASKEQEESRIRRVIVIDDIHLLFGVDDNTCKTHNIQLAISALMSICDDPHRVAGTETARIPIILSANDLSRLYGGLLRAGRMRAVALSPSEPERWRIAGHILRNLMTPEQAAHIAQTHPKWPLAAFRQLQSVLQRLAFNRRHAGLTAVEILAEFPAHGTPAEVATTPRRAFDSEEIAIAVASVDAENLAKRDFSNIEQDEPTN